MFHSLWLPGHWRINCIPHGDKASCKHHRHVVAHSVAQTQVDKIRMGTGPVRFSGSQPWFFLCPSRRSLNALLRHYLGTARTYYRSHGSKHHPCAGSYRLGSSINTQTSWNI